MCPDSVIPDQLYEDEQDEVKAEAPGVIGRHGLASKVAVVDFRHSREFKLHFECLHFSGKGCNSILCDTFLVQCFFFARPATTLVELALRFLSTAPQLCFVL